MTIALPKGPNRVPGRRLAEGLGWFAAYVGSGLAALWLQHGASPAFWYPPVAVGIAVLVRGGPGRWPIVLAGDLVISWLQYGPSPGPVLVVSTMTVVECVVPAWLFRRMDLDPSLRRGVRTLPLIAVFAVVGSLASATLGSLALRQLPQAPAITWSSWFVWWAGDAVTTITILPAILVGLDRSPSEAKASRRHPLERVALFAATALLGLRRLLPFAELAQVLDSVTLGFAPALWAATRFDRRATACVVAVYGVMSAIVHRAVWEQGAHRIFDVPADLVVRQGNLALVAIASMMVVHAITQEREARQSQQALMRELREREAHLRFAQRAAASGSWEEDPASGEMLCSDMFYELAGLDDRGGPVTQAAFERAVHPESVPTLRRFRDAVHAGVAHAELTLRLADRGGREVWHAMRIERVERAGRVTIVGTLTDVSELVRRRAESEQLARIVSSVADGIVTLDREGTILSANAAAATLFGLGGDRSLVGRRITDWIHGQGQGRVVEELHKVFAGVVIEPRPGELRRADGRTLPVRVSLAPLHDVRGRIVAATVVIGDLTPIRRLEEQLVQAQKLAAVGRLTGGIAHDFNNLLTVLMGFSELVRARVANDRVARNDIEQVVRAAERAAALTQRLLAFSRRQPRNSEPLEMDRLIGEIVPTMQRLVGETVHLEFRAGAPGARVMLDPTQLEQVLLNLVVNAHDAMPGGGRVQLETARVTVEAERRAREPDLPAGPVVTLSFADTGSGMDPETRARIFEPFFTTKESGRGTGLGLSTVQAIVRENEGAIRVQSEPGKGTTFRLFFAELPGVASPTPPRSPEPEPPGGTESVLVVEDDALVRDFLFTCLGGAGYPVQVATTAEQGIAVLESGEARVDLVVTDIVLPNASGLELVRRARELRPGIPVLMISGYSEALFEGRLAERVLGKPFTREALLLAVRGALQEPGPRASA